MGWSQERTGEVTGYSRYLDSFKKFWYIRGQRNGIEWRSRKIFFLF